MMSNGHVPYAYGSGAMATAVPAGASRFGGRYSGAVYTPAGAAGTWPAAAPYFTQPDHAAFPRGPYLHGLPPPPHQRQHQLQQRQQAPPPPPRMPLMHYKQVPARRAWTLHPPQAASAPRPSARRGVKRSKADARGTFPCTFRNCHSVFSTRSELTQRACCVFAVSVFTCHCTTDKCPVVTFIVVPRRPPTAHRRQTILVPVCRLQQAVFVEARAFDTSVLLAFDRVWQFCVLFLAASRVILRLCLSRRTHAHGRTPFQVPVSWMHGVFCAPVQLYATRTFRRVVVALARRACLPFCKLQLTPPSFTRPAPACALHRRWCTLTSARTSARRQRARPRTASAGPCWNTCRTTTRVCLRRPSLCARRC